MSTVENMKKLLTISDYVCYGQPTKKVLDDIIRKRGYLKTASHTRTPISNNVVIEELLGSQGIICIEDLIDALWNCKKNQTAYESVRQLLWPIQLSQLKQGIEDGVIKHDATGRDIKKVTTKSEKGGYLGMMGDQINEFVSKLI